MQSPIEIGLRQVLVYVPELCIVLIMKAYEVGEEPGRRHVPRAGDQLDTPADLGRLRQKSGQDIGESAVESQKARRRNDRQVGWQPELLADRNSVGQHLGANAGCGNVNVGTEAGSEKSPSAIARTPAIRPRARSSTGECATTATGACARLRVVFSSSGVMSCCGTGGDRYPHRTACLSTGRSAPPYRMRSMPSPCCRQTRPRRTVGHATGSPGRFSSRQPPARRATTGAKSSITGLFTTQYEMPRRERSAINFSHTSSMVPTSASGDFSTSSGARPKLSQTCRCTWLRAAAVMHVSYARHCNSGRKPLRSAISRTRSARRANASTRPPAPSGAVCSRPPSRLRD